MDIDKIPLLEKLMDGIGNQRPYPEDSLEGVRPGAQMGDGPEVLKGMPLLLQGIIRCGSAFDVDLFCLDLKGLLCLRRSHQGSLDNDGSTYIKLADFCEVVKTVPVNHLEGLKKCAVIHN